MARAMPGGIGDADSSATPRYCFATDFSSPVLNPRGEAPVDRQRDHGHSLHNRLVNIHQASIVNSLDASQESQP